MIINLQTSIAIVLFTNLFLFKVLRDYFKLVSLLIRVVHING